MSTRATGEQYDTHGKRLRAVHLTLMRSVTAYGEPTGSYSLFLDVGKRQISIAIPEAEWNNLVADTAFSASENRSCCAPRLYHTLIRSM